MITWAWPGALTSSWADVIHFPLGWVGDSSLTQHTPLQIIPCSSVPIYWDSQDSPFLPGICRGHPLVGLMVPPGRWTEVKTTGISQGPLWRSHRSGLPTLRPMACLLMRDPVKTGTSTTIAAGKIGISPKYRSLLLTGDTGRAVLHSLQWPLAIKGQATTGNWSQGTPDCTTPMQTLPI